MIIETEYPEKIVLSEGGTILCDSIGPVFKNMRLGVWERPISALMEPGKSYTMKIELIPVD